MSTLDFVLAILLVLSFGYILLLSGDVAKLHEQLRGTSDRLNFELRLNKLLEETLTQLGERVVKLLRDEKAAAEWLRAQEAVDKAHARRKIPTLEKGK